MSYIYSMNLSQKGIWENETAYRKTPINTISVRLTVSVSDPIKVKDAVDKVIKSADVFRAVLLEKGKKARFSLSALPVSLSETTRVMSYEAAMKYAVQRDTSRLPEGNLYEAKILPLSDGRMMIYARFHHIILDGFSMSLFAQRILDVLNGHEIPESLFFENNKDPKSNEEEDRAFWLDYFKDVDYSPSVFSETSGKTEKEVLTRPVARYLTEAVSSFAEKNSLTEASVLMACQAIYLAQATMKKDAVFLVPRLNRRPEEMDTIGCYTLVVPVRVHIEDDDDFLAVCKKTLSSSREASKHKAYGFSNIMKLLQSDGVINDSISEYVFNYYSKKPESKDVRYSLYISVAGAMHNHITLTAETVSQKCQVFTIDGRKGLIDQERLSFFEDSMETILRQGLYESSEKVMDFTIIGEVEEMRLFTQRGACSPYDRRETIVSRFLNAVERFSKRPAIYAGKDSLTYLELDELTDRIASSLIERGVTTGDRVVILLNRDINLIPAEIGILKAGAAFVPVDTGYPDERVKLIIEDSGAVMTIASKDSEKAGIDYVDIEELVKGSGVYVRPYIDGESLAYMIYTSGTTGKPKGVMLPHRGIVNITRPDNNPFNKKLVKDCYGLTAVGSVGFDISIFEFFVPLMNGIFVELAPEDSLSNARELSEVIMAHGADALHLTPSRLESYLKIREFAEVFKSVKAVLSAGEALGSAFAERLSRDYNAEVFNGYGPTETTIGVTITDAGDTETIGRPIGNMGVVILGQGKTFLPFGATGEITAVGRGLGLGYRNLPEKTREKYFYIGNIPAYRTGDLGYFNPDGTITFRGRNDRLIKLRGLRIELPEIENAISDVEGVSGAACIVKRTGKSEHLIAFYTLNKGAEVSSDDIEYEISLRLPLYMIPDVLVHLDTMPQTISGKTDMKALSNIEVNIRKKFVAPRDEDEEFIVEAMKEILGLEELSVGDDFFESGGTSLDTATLMIKLEERFGEDSVNTSMIYQYPTPALLKGKLRGKVTENKINPLTKLDYSGFDELLEKDDVKRTRKDPGNILIMGVTGYLGVHVLFDILSRPDEFKGHIYCIARSMHKNSAEKRVRTALFYYMDSDFGELYGDKWEVIEGDITEDSIKDLNVPIDTVINCAAKVAHFAADDSLDMINTKGVENLIELCKKKNATLCQISTISVGGVFKNDGVQRTFSENDFFTGQEISNQYINSKYMAEYAILRNAVDNGLDFKLIRIGNLQGRISDGEFQMNLSTNAFTRQISSYVKIGAVPYEVYSSRVNFSPVDDTAHMINSLIASIGELKIFHVYPPDEAPYSGLFDSLKKIGYFVDVISQSEFERKISALKKEPGGTKKIEGLLMEKPDISYSPPLTVNSLTLDALKDLSEKWHPMTEEYFTKYLTVLDDMCMFMDI